MKPRSGPTCPAREAVTKLRALGDARAIPALQAAINRKGKGRLRNRPANACLIAEARAALKHLRNLTTQVARDAGPI